MECAYYFRKVNGTWNVPTTLTFVGHDGQTSILAYRDFYANSSGTAEALTSSRGWFKWLYTIVSGSIPNAW